MSNANSTSISKTFHKIALFKQLICLKNDKATMGNETYIKNTAETVERFTALFDFDEEREGIQLLYSTEIIQSGKDYFYLDAYSQLMTSFLATASKNDRKQILSSITDTKAYSKSEHIGNLLYFTDLSMRMNERNSYIVHDLKTSLFERARNQFESFTYYLLDYSYSLSSDAVMETFKVFVKHEQLILSDQIEADAKRVPQAVLKEILFLIKTNFNIENENGKNNFLELQKNFAHLSPIEQARYAILMRRYKKETYNLLAFSMHDETLNIITSLESRIKFEGYTPTNNESTILKYFILKTVSENRAYAGNYKYFVIRDALRISFGQEDTINKYFPKILRIYAKQYELKCLMKALF